jgi:hypothetical protein
MKVRIKELMDIKEVDSIPKLHSLLLENDATVSQRTLYKWFNGGSFQSEKVEGVAKAAGVPVRFLVDTS